MPGYIIAHSGWAALFPAKLTSWLLLTDRNIIAWSEEQSLLAVIVNSLCNSTTATNLEFTLPHGCLARATCVDSFMSVSIDSCSRVT